VEASTIRMESRLTGSPGTSTGRTVERTGSRSLGSTDPHTRSSLQTDLMNQGRSWSTPWEGELPWGSGWGFKLPLGGN